MSGSVLVSSLTTGVPIAADLGADADQYQKIKLADGTPGSTDFIKGDSVKGLAVNVTAVGVSVPITGTVQVSGPVQASGTVTVNVSGVVPVTTQTSVSVSGLPVWFNPGALVSLSGTGVVSVVPGVSVVAQVSGTITELRVEDNGSTNPGTVLAYSKLVDQGGVQTEGKLKALAPRSLDTSVHTSRFRGNRWLMLGGSVRETLGQRSAQFG
jgi:hypothetical protein